MNKNGNQFETLLHDLDRVKRRQKICKKSINENINNVINVLQNSLNQINNTYMEEEDNSKLKSKLQDLSTEVLKIKPLDQVTKSHKDYFAYLSKLGKDIDKSFNKDIDKIFKGTNLEGEQINNVIQEHFLREGKFEIQNSLKKELNIQSNPKVEENFHMIHLILEEIKKENIEPALQWALTNEKTLEEIESNLIFNIYQQKFLQEVASKGKEDAIKFARINFPKFFPKYAPEIQKLMGSLLYDRNPNNSRYSYLYDTNQWEKISLNIIQDACKIHHTTPQSALDQILGAGTLALPKFLKYYSLSSHNAQDWKNCEELPVATDLGKDYQFHSIFVCPVTKEISTFDNPPMLLNCGHVISEHALKKILSGNKTRFKCPYCPAEISVTSSKRIYLN